MRKAGIAVAVAAFAALAVNNTVAESGPAVATETTWQVDARGRPPFARRQVELPVVDVAAIESMEGIETVTVWQVDTSGRPPYDRRRVEVPVVDAASLEVVAEEQRRPDFRGRPPFRRN